MNRSHRIAFDNGRGQQLAGRLELPPTIPRAFALFAHCFTCGKDVAAATRIGRALAARGFGVLRLDFTGLGGSGGDFANQNFSSNVDDLVAASRSPSSTRRRSCWSATASAVRRCWSRPSGSATSRRW